MDPSFLHAVLAGGGASLLFQAIKGEWGKWPTIIMALLTASGAGLTQGGGQEAMTAGLTAMSTHSLLLNNGFGDAIKLNLGPRFLRLVSEIMLALAKGFENKPTQ